MDLRAVLVLFSTVLAVVFGQNQCGDQRKCVPLSDCVQYRPYAGKHYRTWPIDVKNEVKQSFCGVEQGMTGKIFKLCCKTDDPMQADQKSGRDLLDLNQCGKQSSDHIAHGEIAQVFQFPWMALLGRINGDFHCGGSLIAESFVLSAAHCNRQKVEVVRVGDTDLSTEMDCNYFQGEEDCADPYQDIQVDRFIRHPNYSASKKKNDIALIKLKNPAQLNYNVRPICLPLAELLPRQLPLGMTISGYRYRNKTSNQLRYSRVPIIEPNQCQQYMRQLSDVFTLDEGQVCTDSNGNCNGDSGGPLQYFGNKSAVILGVRTWEMGSCGEESAPSVYTKVSHYLDWIIDNLK